MFAVSILLSAVCAFGGEVFRPKASLSRPLRSWERIEGSVYYADQPGTFRIWGGERNAKSFTHALGDGRTFVSGRLVVRKDRWTRGTMHVEVSRDGEDWIRLGEAKKGEFFEAELPGAVFPAATLHVRFNGDEGCSYELNGYSLDLVFEGARLWQAGSTNAFYRSIVGNWMDPLVWTCSSNRKVPRFGSPDRGRRAKALRLAVAANETESVQFVISPQTDLQGVGVEVELAGLEAEALAVDWRRVAQATDSRGVTGFWPDPIRPQAPEGLFIPGGSNRSFWIRVKAPKGTAKGVRRGVVRLHAKGGGDMLRCYPIEVRVFGFELPDESSVKTNFGFDEWRLRMLGYDPVEWQRALDAHKMTRFGRHGYRYVFDEPTTNQYAEVRRLCLESKAKFPEERRLVTVPPCRELEGFVDIWCPRTDSYDAAAAAACRARRESYWWYICCGPTSPYAGLFVDRPGHELRLWLWQTWAEGVDGVLIWHTHNLSKEWDDTGDGTFFYPDADGHPVDTVRAEAFRDGVEDYEYFAILKRLDPKNPLLAVPRDVSASLKDFNRDPVPLESHRIKLAMEIERRLQEGS